MILLRKPTGLGEPKLRTYPIYSGTYSTYRLQQVNSTVLSLKCLAFSARSCSKSRRTALQKNEKPRQNKYSINKLTNCEMLRTSENIWEHLRTSENIWERCLLLSWFLSVLMLRFHVQARLHLRVLTSCSGSCFFVVHPGRSNLR